VQDLSALPLDRLFQTLNAPDQLARLLTLAALEEFGPAGPFGPPGDVTTRCCIPPGRPGVGRIVARENGILSGLATVQPTLRTFAPACTTSFSGQDGQPVAAGQTLATITGPLAQILQAERTLLNLIGRMSGIATRTAEFARRIHGLPAKILDTRKTTPGLRALEKYAVRCGGGHLHRTGLHDAVLFKDNHLRGLSPAQLPAFVRDAITRARQSAKDGGYELAFVELEVESLEQLEAVLSAGICGPSSGGGVGWVDFILLDNMAPATLRQAIAARARHKAQVLYEASGGVTLDTIRAIAETGIDRISIGGLTHHAVSINVAMDVDTPG